MPKKEFKFTDKQKELYNACTKLERLTVINHIQGSMSQRAAYYEAGGRSKSHKSADANVSRMLGTDRVKAFSDSLVEKMAGNSIMVRDEALEILSDIGRIDIDDEDEFKYKVQPKLSAIKQISTMEGWEAAQKHEHTGKDGGAIETKSLSNEDLARKLAFLLTKGDK
jgi:phage terminase small subunit